jgi:hypothetical protein
MSDMFKNSVPSLGRGVLVLFMLSTYCLTGGCAKYLSEFTPTPGKEHISDGIWTFRHKVRLDIPSRDVSQSFDGLMRLNLAEKTAHIVGVGVLGMRLFDIKVTPERIMVGYIHPMLLKIPRVEEQIAFCVRRIWFDCLVIVPQPASLSGLGWSFVSSRHTVDNFWPDLITFANTQDNYTLTIRLLHVQREEMP